MNTTAIKTTATEKTLLLSKRGMKELKRSIASLTHDRQKAIQELHELDKLTDHDSRLNHLEKLARLEIIESQLQDKELALQSAKLIPTRRARMQVAIGSVVDLIDTQGRIFRYMLVDSIEANPSDGRISIASPLGRNLLGKTVRDVIEWTSGMRPNKLQLVSIS